MAGGRSVRCAGGRAAYVMTACPFAPQSPASSSRTSQIRSVVGRASRTRAEDAASPVNAGRRIRFGEALVSARTLYSYASAARWWGLRLRARRAYPSDPLIVAAVFEFGEGLHHVGRCAASRVVVWRLVRKYGVIYGQPGPFAPGRGSRVFEGNRDAMRQVGRKSGGKRPGCAARSDIIEIPARAVSGPAAHNSGTSVTSYQQRIVLRAGPILGTW